MTAPEALTPAAPPARVPASTIRAVRIFHGFTPEQFADVFEVSVRTVFRWESDGVDPMSLKLDPNAHPNAGPEWRRKYLIWLLDRYQQLRVTDNPKTTRGSLMNEASLWVLCVMLERTADVPWKVCQVEPSHAKCTGDLRDWIDRGYAWERRSGLGKAVLATCEPLPPAGKDHRS